MFSANGKGFIKIWLKQGFSTTQKAMSEFRYLQSKSPEYFKTGPYAHEAVFLMFRLYFLGENAEALREETEGEAKRLSRTFTRPMFKRRRSR